MVEGKKQSTFHSEFRDGRNSDIPIETIAGISTEAAIRLAGKIDWIRGYIAGRGVRFSQRLAPKVETAAAAIPTIEKIIQTPEITPVDLTRDERRVLRRAAKTFVPVLHGIDTGMLAATLVFPLG